MRVPGSLDPAVTVVGLRSKYHAPDLETVDLHLQNLANRLRAVGRGAPKLVAEYWHDIDLLLGRRSYLMAMCGEGRH